MGGGGVMKAAAAAKLARIVAMNSGIRGASVPVEQSVRNPSRQISTVLSASSAGVAVDVAPVKPLHYDDGEVAGGENDPFLDSGEPLPRVVFGGAPTLKEATDATTDLKAALDVYLTRTNTESSGSIGSDLTCKTKAAGVPQVAMEAFTMLNKSPAIQSAVASIASDPNVWNAVMQNEVLIEFLQNQETNGESHASESNNNVEAEEVLDQESPSEASEESQRGNFKTMMMGAFKHIKAQVVNVRAKVANIRAKVVNIRPKVVNMVGSMTSFLQDIFAIPSGDNKSENGPTFAEKTMATSIMGLAVMVVMVVVLKRI